MKINICEIIWHNSFPHSVITKCNNTINVNK